MEQPTEHEDFAAYLEERRWFQQGFNTAREQYEAKASLLPELVKVLKDSITEFEWAMSGAKDDADKHRIRAMLSELLSSLAKADALMPKGVKP